MKSKEWFSLSLRVEELASRLNLGPEMFAHGEAEGWIKFLDNEVEPALRRAAEAEREPPMGTCPDCGVVRELREFRA